MEFLTFKQLNQKEKRLVQSAFKAAKQSVSDSCMVGAAILSNKNKIFTGATIARTRAIGSTCSERMALDQLYFSNKHIPAIVCTIGTFSRPGWQNDFVCTPCGVCLEMLLECVKKFNIDDISFICSSWDKTKILKCSLKDLFPQIGKGNWKRV